MTDINKKNKDSINYLFTIHNNCIDNIKLADQKATALIAINSVIVIGLFRSIYIELETSGLGFSEEPRYMQAIIIMIFLILLTSIILPVFVILPRVRKVTREILKHKKEESSTNINFVNPSLISSYQPLQFQCSKEIIYDDFKNFKVLIEKGKILTDENQTNNFNKKLIDQLLEYIYVLSVVNNIKYSRLEPAIGCLIINSILLMAISFYIYLLK